MVFHGKGSSNVFQTSGRLLETDDNGHYISEEVYRARYKGERSIQVKRAIATSVGQACFAAFVEAPNGTISQGADQEVCTTTEHPPFFEGCSLSERGSPRPWAHLGWLAIAGLLWLRSRPRQRQAVARTRA